MRVGHKSVFDIPEGDRPIVMLAHGTAITPFVSVIAALKSAGRPRTVILYYGIRHIGRDFLFGEELTEALLALGSGSRLELVESRPEGETETPAGVSRSPGEKQYVQDRVAAQAEELQKLKEAGAYFMLCGNGNTMARDVEVILEASVFSSPVDEMIQTGRYMKEAWNL